MGGGAAEGGKHAAQWTATLKTYAGPVMGRLLVRDVELSHVIQVLEPIWIKTHCTSGSDEGNRPEATPDNAREHPPTPVSLPLGKS